MKKSINNSKAEAIKQFILLNSPTRKEIVKFIACRINGSSEETFDRDYKDTLRGYYSTNFTAWKWNGNTVVKEKRYYITDACRKEGNGLYSVTNATKIERLEKANKNLIRMRDEALNNGRKVAADNVRLRDRISFLENTIQNTTPDNVLRMQNESLRTELSILQADLNEIKKAWNTINRISNK